MKKKQALPRGWDEERIRKAIAHYENQTEDEELAEDEAAFDAPGQTTLVVPTRLVPSILRLLGRQQSRSRPNGRTRRKTVKA